jgi:CRISPR-associated protein Cas1
MARLGASEAGLELRGVQHRWAADPNFCLEFAREAVRGKVRNQRRLLSRSAGGREPPVAEARAAMDRVLAQVGTAKTIPVLRGLEGHASAHYFRALRALLNPEYGFRSRNRRPPRDPANALLSFA